MNRFRQTALLLLCMSAAACAQSSTSTVHGSVRDSSDAVIPAASVTLTATATGVERKTAANEAGYFAFPGVTPGPYRITVEAAGMQRFEGTLTVQVQVDAEVNAVLRVGQANTTVEVKDVTPMVQTDSPTLGHVLETQRIQELPVNGRGYQNLLVTVPAVTWSSQGFGIGALVQAYGLRPGTTTLTFDGAAQNEVWEGWDVARTPDLDTIQEMQVETNNSSAKFTRPTTIVMSSKSGTNQLHGGLFYTNRNSGYGVARMRQDTFLKPPYLNRNEWGESVGGPVYIPKVYNGHNRTFFFFSWEDIRSLQYTTSQQSFPTVAMRNGDFRGITDSLGRAYNFYDPSTTGANYSRSPDQLQRHRQHDLPVAGESDSEISLRHHSAAQPTCGESAGRAELGRTDSALTQPGSEDRPHRPPVLGIGPVVWALFLRSSSRVLSVRRTGNAERHFRRGPTVVAGSERCR